MKTIGKIGSGFFCGFLVFLIAGVAVLSVNGGLYNAAVTFADAMNLRFSSHFDPEGLNGIQFSDYKFSAAGMDYSDSKTVSAEGVENLTVDAEVCAVEVRRADVQEFTADFKSAKGSNGMYASLELRQQQDGVHARVSSGGTEHTGWQWAKKLPQSRLTLSVPQSYRGGITVNGKVVLLDMEGMQDISLLNVDVKVGRVTISRVAAGSIGLDVSGTETRLDGLKAQNDVRLNASMGSLQCDGLEAQSINVQSGMGSVVLNGVAGSFTGDFSMGDADIAFSEMRGNADISGSMTDIKVTLPRVAPVRLSVSGGMKSVEDNVRWTDGQYRMADARYAVNVRGSMGSVRLSQAG